MPIWFIIWMILWFGWLMYETDWMRVRLPVGNDTPLLTRVEFEAVSEVLLAKTLAKGNAVVFNDTLQDMVGGVSTELGLRCMPYHGRAHNGYPGKTTRDLDIMLKVYQCFQ